MHFLTVCPANDEIVTWFVLVAKWLVKKGNSKGFSTFYAHTQAITGATSTLSRDYALIAGVLVTSVNV